MLAENGVPITEIEQAGAAVVDPKNTVRETGVHAQVVEMIEVAGPARTLVDLLQRDDVGCEPFKQLRYAAQVGPQLGLRREALDWIQAAGVRDVKRDKAQARHSE